MKQNKGWKMQFLLWFREEGWIYLGLIVVLGLIMSLVFLPKNSNSQSEDEQLRTEEFTYKGHKYIKFKGHDMLGTGSVVHDPDCECQLKKDSI